MAENTDLKQERSNATITTKDFAIWWAGGSYKLKQRRSLEKIFFADADFQDTQPTSTMSHQQFYAYTTAKAAKFICKLRKWYDQQIKCKGAVKNTIECMHEFRSILAGPLGTGLFQQSNPLRLHFSMFLTAILNLSTAEQCDWWLERSWLMDGIIGSYAQTELGHGSYLKGLETRADYNVTTEEFILNTPTITSYKWWPGGMGHTANKVVLMAQLYIKGVHYGLQPFLLRIRDKVHHTPKPGVDVGEIGPKMGVNGTDNGFLGLKNVRIPLRNMLAGNAKVLPNGTFVKTAQPQMLYATMVYVRVVMVKDASFNLLQAATIATRYSAVRRQGIDTLKQPEIQILDLQTQQGKVLPQIAKGICFRLMGDYLWHMYCSVREEVVLGINTNLPELHALSCCLKALSTHEAAKGVEILRKACGGHGYIASSNFSNIYGTATAACTYEGENTVLLLQTGRFLLKCYMQSLVNDNLPKTVAYFLNTELHKLTLDTESLIFIIELTSKHCTRYAFERQQELGHILNDPSSVKANNKCGLILLKTALLYGKAITARTAFDYINFAVKDKKVSASLKSVLREILDIFIMDMFLHSLDDVLRFSKISNHQINSVERHYEQYLLSFRRNAVAVVDGFDFHDCVLGSTLGCYDGRVYERLMEEARKSPLNRESVHPVFTTHLKPLMKAKL